MFKTPFKILSKYVSKIHIYKKQNFVTHKGHANSKAIKPGKLKHEVSANKVPNIAINVNKTNEKTTNLPQNSETTILSEIQMQSEEKGKLNQPPSYNLFSPLEEAAIVMLLFSRVLGSKR